MALHDISTTRQTRWEIDPGSTSVGFSIGRRPHRVTGHFLSVRGWAVAHGDDPRDASIQVEIDAASIDTSLTLRDGHLRNGLFLDVERFPTISFVSTGVDDQGDNRLTVFGELTIRGITRHVALDATIEGRDGESAQITASTVLDRRDYGIGPWLMGITAGNRATVCISLALRAR